MKFKTNLSVLDVKRIKNSLINYGKIENQKIEIEDSVLNFLSKYTTNIEMLSKQGILMKNKDVSLKKEFYTFLSVVKNEISRDLKDAQEWPSFFMSKMRSVANYSVPGSGKTAMIYGTYAYLSSSKVSLVDKIVVVGPKSSFLSWKNEFNEVFGKKRQLNVLDIHSDVFSREDFYKNIDNYNLILINYESLVKYEKELLKLVDSKTMLVFDEVHKIKKIESFRSQLAIKISSKTSYKYILTGTPIPNNYSDLWTSLKILYGDAYDYYFGKNPKELENMNNNEIDQFNHLLFPFYWRITKNELKIPSVCPDNIIEVESSKNENDLIKSLWRKYKSNPLVLYTRLIQVSSNPQLLLDKLDKSNPEFNYKINDDIPHYTSSEKRFINTSKLSNKSLEAIKLTEKLTNDNKVVLIWCIYKDTMEKLEFELLKLKLNVKLIYGDTLIGEREKIISDFNEGRIDVLIANPHTIGESVSLHKKCHDAIYLEFSFNLVHMLQSRDRIHRLGLKLNEETKYYYFMTKSLGNESSTIDRLIYDRLMDKKERMINAIEGTHISSMNIHDESEEIIELMKSI